jgi:two-component system chemotaxis response regulator CheB
MQEAANGGNRTDGAATGYVCPTCGGALWERAAGDGQQAYECRIGHAFSAEQLWIAHCTQRNRTLAAAARILAENAALAHDLAALGRALGKDTLAARLEQEAAQEQRYFEQVQVMLEAIAQDDTTIRR